MESIFLDAFHIDPLKFVDGSSGCGMVDGAGSLAVRKTGARIVFTEERLKDSFFRVKSSVSSRSCCLSYVAVVPRTTIVFRHHCRARLCHSSRLRGDCKLFRAYSHSTTTLDYLQSLLTSGFALLRHPRNLSLSHVHSPSLRFVNITR